MFSQVRHEHCSMWTPPVQHLCLLMTKTGISQPHASKEWRRIEQLTPTPNQLKSSSLLSIHRNRNGAKSLNTIQEDWTQQSSYTFATYQSLGHTTIKHHVVQHQGAECGLPSLLRPCGKKDRCRLPAYTSLWETWRQEKSDWKAVLQCRVHVLKMFSSE